MSCLTQHSLNLYSSMRTEFWSHPCKQLSRVLSCSLRCWSNAVEHRDASRVTSKPLVMPTFRQRNYRLGASINHTLGSSNQAAGPATEQQSANNGLPAASSCRVASAGCTASAFAGKPGHRPTVIMRITSASGWATALLLALASAEAQFVAPGAAASVSPATAAAAASAAQAAAAAEAIVASTAVDPAAASAASASAASASAAAAATEVPSPLPAGSPALPAPVAAQPPPPAVETTVSVPPPPGGNVPPPASSAPPPPQAPSPPAPPPPLGAHALT